jgi:hypothetical protein
MAPMTLREKTRCISYYHTQVYPVPVASQGSLWDAACLTQEYAGEDLAGLSDSFRCALSSSEKVEQMLLTIESTSCEVKTRPGAAEGLPNSVPRLRQKSATVVCKSLIEHPSDVEGAETGIGYSGECGEPVSMGCVCGELQEIRDAANPWFGCTYDSGAVE